MDYQLAVAFDSDAPEFARGVEIGMLWQRLQCGPLPATAVVHARNTEMVLRLAEAMKVSVCADDLGDEWLAVTLG